MTASKHGRFTLSREHLESIGPDGEANLLHGIVTIFKVEMSWDSDHIKYLATHPDFADVPEDAPIPEYIPVFMDGQIYPKWVQI